MRVWGLLIAGLLVGTTLPAHADDSRIVTLPWKANVVHRVTARGGVQAAIAFGADEHIENVAIGDANLWQVTPNKRVNMLFIKPLRAHARTNLTVVTDSHTYFFDLVAAPGAPPLYMLRFAYPEVAKPTPPPAPLTAEESAIAKGDAPPPLDPSALDFGWAVRGNHRLAPARVFDDGRDTYLAWGEHATLPAILAEDGKGGEGPVNFTTRGDVIVVEGVPGRIVLRAGKDSAVLEHSGGASRPAAPVASNLPDPGPLSKPSEAP